MGPRRVKAKPRKSGVPKPVFILLSISCWSFRILVVFEARFVNTSNFARRASVWPASRTCTDAFGALKCARLEFWVVVRNPSGPEAAGNHQKKTPRERQKEQKCGGRGEKKATFWGSSGGEAQRRGPADMTNFGQAAGPTFANGPLPASGRPPPDHPPPDRPPPDRPPPDRPKFRAFFSPAPMFALFLSLWLSSRVFFPLSGGLLVEFWWCFGGSGPQMCWFSPLGCRLEAPGG